MIDLGGDITGNGVNKLVFTILCAVAEVNKLVFTILCAVAEAERDRERSPEVGTVAVRSASAIEGDDTLLRSQHRGQCKL
jgi:hypothetical protein